MSWVDAQWPMPSYKKSIRDQRTAQAKVYVSCKNCGAHLEEVAFLDASKVCELCGHHHILTAPERLDMLADDQKRHWLGQALQPNDHLAFRDLKPYAERLTQTQKKNNLTEAVLTSTITIGSRQVVVAVFDFRFIGGSLGSVAGDRVLLGIEEAIKRKLPFVCITASGGARMQEGILSLFQMARMSAAVSRLKAARLPFINVLTHPTFGGVSASIAMQADIIIAERGAHIGFTGARVIANAMHQKLPEGFQTAEFLRDHGAIDAVVERAELRDYLIRTLRKATHNQRRHEKI